MGRAAATLAANSISKIGAHDFLETVDRAPCLPNTSGIQAEGS
jgi:hypothetical protein